MGCDIDQRLNLLPVDESTVSARSSPLALCIYSQKLLEHRLYSFPNKLSISERELKILDSVEEHESLRAFLPASGSFPKRIKSS